MVARVLRADDTAQRQRSVRTIGHGGRREGNDRGTKQPSFGGGYPATRTPMPTPTPTPTSGSTTLPPDQRHHRSTFVWPTVHA